MKRQDLYDKTDRYLQERSEIDASLFDIREAFETLKEKYDTSEERIERIKTLMNGLGTLPTLGKLREFLQTLREMFQD